MKKLRMIVASVLVLAIVGGTFAFKTKVGTYCVRIASSGSGNCTALKFGYKFTTNFSAEEYFINPFWDGEASHCTQDASNGCTTPYRVRLNFD